MTELNSSNEFLTSNQQRVLINIGKSLLSSVMETMQKSQCNHKYSRYQSPSIVSPRISPTFLRPQLRKNEKRNLPPVETLSLNHSPVNLKGQELKFSKTQIPKPENLEITGTCKVYPIFENRKSAFKYNLEMRKMSISKLEDKKKEEYYYKYNSKLKQVEYLREVYWRNKLNELVKLRRRRNNFATFDDRGIETSEICLQTPVYFNE